MPASNPTVLDRLLSFSIPAADEVFLAVSSWWTSELSAETTGEIKLVIEPAGGGVSAERRYDQKYTL